jgi:membrane protease YdiL (CAAX protease family)
MSDEPITPDEIPRQSKFAAWTKALAITLLGCLLGGFGCFLLAGRYLLRQVNAHEMTLFQAAVRWEIAFTVAMALILAVIVVWQRAHGWGLKELGWRRPTTPLALVLALLLGAAFLSGNYMSAHFLLPGVDVLELNWTRVALAPLGLFIAFAEETMMRGFFMTQLQKARVATWLQIVASGACSASYHSFQNPTLIGFLPSCILFSLHAGLYVLGKRSLTPVVLTHSMYHVFGEPYLLMLALAAMNR